MRVEDKLNEYIMKCEGEGKTRVRSGKYSIGGLGTCYRRQYLDRLDVKKSDLGLDVLKRFQMGTIIHEFLQSLYGRSSCEVLCETDHFKGYADIVSDDEVIDIKSVDGFAWSYIKVKKGESFQDHRRRVIAAKINNVYQVVYYAHLLGKEKAWLCFVNKNSMECIEILVLVRDYIDPIMKEVKDLEIAWNNQQVPEASPRLYGGTRECNYCNVSQTCKECELF